MTDEDYAKAQNEIRLHSMTRAVYEDAIMVLAKLRAMPAPTRVTMLDGRQSADVQVCWETGLEGIDQRRVFVTVSAHVGTLSDLSEYGYTEAKRLDVLDLPDDFSEIVQGIAPRAFWEDLERMRGGGL